MAKIVICRDNNSLVIHFYYFITTNVIIKYESMNDWKIINVKWHFCLGILFSNK